MPSGRRWARSKIGWNGDGNRRKVPVKLPCGKTLELSFGPHNDLQKAIIEEFLPRYAACRGSALRGRYGEETAADRDRAVELARFFELAHEALPDVVAYDATHNWLFLIEAVHSANPISKLRHLMLERMTEKCTAPRIYVSVFKDRAALRQWLLEISWETEVWLVESPDHLIHFDGEQFLRPYAAKIA